MNKILKILSLMTAFVFLFSILGCKQNNINGIEIGSDLYQSQSYEQNKKLESLITKMLNKDSVALKNLIEFWCGGGAGCYDLGYIFTQLVYRIGETDFILLAEGLNNTQKGSLEGFLDVGFEYGNYKKVTTTEIEFPKLTKFLNQKTAKK